MLEKVQGAPRGDRFSQGWDSGNGAGVGVGENLRFELPSAHIAN